MKILLRRYRFFLCATAACVLFLLLLPAYRNKAIEVIVFQTETMLLVIPPIFILLGLLDVWVPREQMMRFMGPGSGLKGTVFAFLLGSFAAGPLYAAFPVAAILMKKGASFNNIIVFIGAWSTTKIPMLLFESSALGLRFALSRLAIDIFGIIIISLLMKALLPTAEIERLYKQAEAFD
ncbi:MAG: permease [Desulfobulbaceae bacterium]|nr:MAG: permease [Desulfobulbaceae bacterium]